jgi:hypothetical protein
MGKPRTRWEDIFLIDTSQIPGMIEWRRRTEDRENWRWLLREATTHKGCSNLDIMNGMDWKTIITQHYLCPANTLLVYFILNMIN